MIPDANVHGVPTVVSNVRVQRIKQILNNRSINVIQSRQKYRQVKDTEWKLF